MAQTQYDENSIVILEGLDAVRKRPGMYIGSTDRRGLHHLVWEILDNSIDEALNGFGNEIIVTLNKDGSCSVEDFGRGMPVGKHKSGKSALEVIFTVLHAGGKFSDSSYKASGGLHGVGASVVNALCSWVKVEVKDGKNIYELDFSNGGRHVGELKVIGKTKQTGSKVTFLPDPTIFKENRFSYSRIKERVQEDAFLLKGLKIRLIDKRENPKEDEFVYEDGLKAFVEELDVDHDPISPVVSFEGESGGIKVQAAFQYVDTYQENMLSFANIVRTRDGGSHETGARQALTRVFNDYARKVGLLKEKDKSMEGSDIREGLTFVLHTAIPETLLQFEGQTKEKLGTPQAKGAVDAIVSENLRYFLEENTDTAATLIRKMIKAGAARRAAREAREKARKGKGKNRSEQIISGKLVHAQSKDARRKELYLVEARRAEFAACERYIAAQILHAQRSGCAAQRVGEFGGCGRTLLRYLGGQVYGLLLGALCGLLTCGEHVVAVLEGFELLLEASEQFEQTVAVIHMMLQLKRVELAEASLDFVKALGVGGKCGLVVYQCVGNVGHFDAGRIKALGQRVEVGAVVA